jgi:hypothetical protein
MKQYNLSDYLKLPTNEVLKIKLKAENDMQTNKNTIKQWCIWSFE